MRFRNSAILRHPERSAAMSIVDALRKGFGFFLMSMGVSSPTKKPPPAQKPAPKTKPGA